VTLYKDCKCGRGWGLGTGGLEGCDAWGLGPKRGGKRWGPKMKTKKAGEKKSQGEGVAPKFYISNVLFVGVLSICTGTFR